MAAASPAPEGAGQSNVTISEIYLMVEESAISIYIITIKFLLRHIGIAKARRGLDQA
jgi:hypothetical protein